jgi:hypothetical protein
MANGPSRSTAAANQHIPLSISHRVHFLDECCAAICALMSTRPTLGERRHRGLAHRLIAVRRDVDNCYSQWDARNSSILACGK